MSYSLTSFQPIKVEKELNDPILGAHVMSTNSISIVSLDLSFFRESFTQMAFQEDLVPVSVSFDPQTRIYQSVSSSW